MSITCWLWNIFFNLYSEVYSVFLDSQQQMQINTVIFRLSILIFTGFLSNSSEDKRRNIYVRFINVIFWFYSEFLRIWGTYLSWVLFTFYNFECLFNGINSVLPFSGIFIKKLCYTSILKQWKISYNIKASLLSSTAFEWRYLLPNF